MNYREIDKLARWISYYLSRRNISVSEDLIYQCLRDFDAQEKLKKTLGKRYSILNLS